ncbi:MAG: hypothetical protein ABJ013_15125 [Halioglobus sp.]
MQRAYLKKQTNGVSEMAIVDTFTKLIFGESALYSSQELLIIQALRSADANVAFDSHGDMGGYLRALGVAEMIHLVADVQQQLASPVPAFVTETPAAVVHSSKNA